MNLNSVELELRGLAVFQAIKDRLPKAAVVWFVRRRNIARPALVCGTASLSAVVCVQVAADMPANDTVRVSAVREAVHGCMPLCECRAQAMEPVGRGQAAGKGIIETRVTTADK